MAHKATNKTKHRKKKTPERYRHKNYTYLRLRFAYVPTSQASSLTRLDNNMMMIITLWKIQTAISSFCSLIWALSARTPYTHGTDRYKQASASSYILALLLTFFLNFFFLCWSIVEAQQSKHFVCSAAASYVPLHCTLSLSIHLNCSHAIVS